MYMSLHFASTKQQSVMAFSYSRQLVKYQPKIFFCILINIKRHSSEFIVPFVEDLGEDQSPTGRLNLIVNFSFFSYRQKSII
jgi:hypothetical protein